MATCYVVSLLLGFTILATSIKVTTVEKYVAAISQLARAKKVPDPIRDMSGVKAPSIKALLAEAKRREKVPTEGNLLPFQWFNMFPTKAEKQKKLGRIDDLASLMSNWLTMGIQSGFGKSEWAQDVSTFGSNFQNNIDGSSKAFTLQDFEFWSKNKKQIHQLTKKDLDKTQFVTMCWRFQKNVDNDQKTTYSRSVQGNDLCYVQAAVNIFLRAIRLKVPADHPVVIYTYYKT